MTGAANGSRRGKLMGLLTQLWQRGDSRALAPVAKRAVMFNGSDSDFLAGNDGGGLATSSGVQVNHEAALTLSALWRGTNLLANGCGMLPCFVMKREGRGWRHDP